MKRGIIVITILASILLSFCGCSKEKNIKEDIKESENIQKITIESDNKKQVEVTFTQIDNLTMVQDGNGFEIFQNMDKENEKKYILMTFMEQDSYENILSQVHENEENKITILEESNINNIEYTFYESGNTDRKQFNRICQIKETGVYMMIYCYDDKDIGEKVFENLTFVIK